MGAKGSLSPAYMRPRQHHVACPHAVPRDSSPTSTSAPTHGRSERWKFRCYRQLRRARPGRRAKARLLRQARRRSGAGRDWELSPVAASMGGALPTLRVGAENGLFGFAPQGWDGAAPALPKEPRCGGIVAGTPCNTGHILEYFGPPPPSGGTQVMLRLGSLISHVLQWTQFCALMTYRG